MWIDASNRDIGKTFEWCNMCLVKLPFPLSSSSQNRFRNDFCSTWWSSPDSYQTWLNGSTWATEWKSRWLVSYLEENGLYMWIWGLVEFCGVGHLAYIDLVLVKPVKLGLNPGSSPVGLIMVCWSSDSIKCGVRSWISCWEVLRVGKARFVHTWSVPDGHADLNIFRPEISLENTYTWLDSHWFPRAWARKEKTAADHSGNHQQGADRAGTRKLIYSSV